MARKTTCQIRCAVTYDALAVQKAKSIDYDATTRALGLADHDIINRGSCASSSCVRQNSGIQGQDLWKICLRSVAWHGVELTNEYIILNASFTSFPMRFHYFVFAFLQLPILLRRSTNSFSFVMSANLSCYNIIWQANLQSVKLRLLRSAAHEPHVCFVLTNMLSVFGNGRRFVCGNYGKQSTLPLALS